MTVLIVRLLLAAVFATAAVAKAAGGRKTPEALRAFGVPRWLVRPVAVVLPAAELGVAAALLPAGSTRYAAIAAAGLLAGFTGAVAYQLARGRRPDCNCFGGLQAAPIGKGTLARNAVLIAGAVFVAARGWHDAGPSATAWLGEPLAAVVAGLGILAVLQGALFMLLLRRHGHLLARLDVEAPEPEPAGLPVGSEAPEFELPSLTGEPVTLAALREEGLPVLLLFSDPACGPCSALLPEVARWQQQWDRELVIAVVSNASLDVNRSTAAEHGLTLVVSQEKHDVSLAYGALGTPMAVLVDANGRIASPVAAGEAGIAELVAQAVSTQEVMLGV